MSPLRTLNARLGGGWRVAGLIAAVCIATFVITQIANRVNTNNAAIEKSCTLLNNVIVQATNATTGQSPATKILIGAFLRQMTPDERRAYLDASKQPTRPFITLVDCKRVANHPDEIRAVPVPQ